MQHMYLQTAINTLEEKVFQLRQTIRYESEQIDSCNTRIDKARNEIYSLEDEILKLKKVSYPDPVGNGPYQNVPHA